MMENLFFPFIYFSKKGTLSLGGYLKKHLLAVLLENIIQYNLALKKGEI